MYSITIQYTVDKTLAPKKSLLLKWAKEAMYKKIESAELNIRIVSVEEMSSLNATYRHKKGATNVLSFPFELPDDVKIDVPILGDIIICADVVNREAQEQQKSWESHWAHMIIHGVFHLLGYDHETEKEAQVMETLEINIMKSLGFADPYETGENQSP